MKIGGKLNPDAVPMISERPLIQIAASMLLSLTFAVLLQQERSTVLWVTLNGGVAWSVYGAMHYVGDISPVASTAVAAGLVGLFGQLLSRYRFASALPYTTAAIGPLLPGSATYFGLLSMAQNDVDKGAGVAGQGRVAGDGHRDRGQPGVGDLPGCSCGSAPPGSGGPPRGPGGSERRPARDALIVGGCGCVRVPRAVPRHPHGAR